MTTRKRKPAVAARVAPVAAEFPVVGIGASAGGLAAIEEFLAAMPTGNPLGMAIVLVQHLDPDHKSLLLDLVKRYTHMEVAWAEDGMEVRSGCAYVMPPNKDMALVGGVLRLVEPEAPRGQRLPIDYFFRSLAADQRERAVCIVLSGTGSDGVIGLRAVKGEGGMVMAQQPDTAGYDGMPRNAIATGDTKTLSSLRGIGKKTAERLVVELKDKVGAAAGSAGSPPVISDPKQADAAAALVSLGYKPADAQKAIAAVADKDATVEELVRAALRGAGN